MERSKFKKNSLFDMTEEILNRIHPQLAKEIGLNESILLLQIDFWAATSDDRRCIHNGMRWTYQTYEEMGEKLPYISVSSIKRAIDNLRKRGLIKVDRFNKVKYDRTNWYRINEVGVQKLSSLRLREEQCGTSKVQTEDAPLVQNGLTIPEITSKTTAEVTSEITSRYTEPKFCQEQNFGNSEVDAEVEPHRNTEGESSTPCEEALRAVQAFRSVGVERFDVTFKDDRTEKIKFFENVNLDEKLPRALELNEEGWSFIVRPNATNLIQVDDVNLEGVRELSAYSFFTEETSAGNFQVWLALPTDTSTEDAKRVRDRLLRRRGGNGNGGAYGATRWAGSINQKPIRNGFRIRLKDATQGWFTSENELEEAGLLAEAEEQVLHSSDSIGGYKAKLPDYEKCLVAKEGDRSKADVSFLFIAKQRGYTREEALAGLMSVSARASESGQAYVTRTADYVFRPAGSK